MKSVLAAAFCAVLLVPVASQASPSIDSPQCYKVAPKKCRITYNTLSDTNAQLLYIRLSVDDKVVANATAFFTTTITVPGDKYGAGFPVACGKLGSGGEPTMGNTHTLRAESFSPGNQSLGFSSSNLLCPPN